VNFGENLQRLREGAGLSQSELARRSDTPLDSLRNWEQSRVLPRIDAVVRLARALDVSLDDLAGGVDFDGGGREPRGPKRPADLPPAQGKPHKRKSRPPRG
jgi:transcriptional regulator with XRE-family HTH domain